MYKVTYDEEARAFYIDLSPMRTKYKGVSARQLSISLRDWPILDHRLSTMVFDLDADDRLLGVEVF